MRSVVPRAPPPQKKEAIGNLVRRFGAQACMATNMRARRSRILWSGAPARPPNGERGCFWAQGLLVGPRTAQTRLKTKNRPAAGIRRCLIIVVVSIKITSTITSSHHHYQHVQHPKAPPPMSAHPSHVSFSWPTRSSTEGACGCVRMLPHHPLRHTPHTFRGPAGLPTHVDTPLTRVVAPIRGSLVYLR